MRMTNGFVLLSSCIKSFDLAFRSGRGNPRIIREHILRFLTNPARPGSCRFSNSARQQKSAYRIGCRNHVALGSRRDCQKSERICFFDRFAVHFERGIKEKNRNFFSIADFWQLHRSIFWNRFFIKFCHNYLVFAHG